MGNSEDLKRHKIPRRLIFLGVLVVLLAICAVLINTDLSAYVIGEGRLERQRTQLETLRAEYIKLNEKLNSGDKLVIHEGDLWRTDLNGAPTTELWAQLGQITSKLGIVIRQIGDLKISKLSDKIVGYELDFTCETSLQMACELLIAISQSQPRFFWVKLLITPSGGNVKLNGQLRIIVVPDEVEARKLWGGTVKSNTDALEAGGETPTAESADNTAAAPAAGETAQ